MTRNSRSRGFCFTINNYTDEQVDEVLALPADYLIFGFEKGKKKETDHIQGYVFFQNARSFESMRNLLYKAHIEKANGTPEQAAEYCKKDGDYYEFGELPVKGRAKWSQIEEAMENPKDNILIYNQYRKVYKEVLNKERQQNIERRIIVIRDTYKYKVASKCEMSVFMDDDIETYDGEEIVFVDRYSGFKVEQWYLGYPPRIKRGYEIIHINPSVVYIVCRNSEEISYVKKKFLDKHIDIDCDDFQEKILEKQAISDIEDNETSES